MKRLEYHELSISLIVMSQKLTTTDHSRDIAGLKYVYPVISRRAGGLSVGINFNTNNACNWRCIYCQVPDLVRGAAPEIDLARLEYELRFFLKQVQEGDFYQQYEVEQAYQTIKDIAISGNGEPTSLKGFDKAVAMIGQIATELGVFPQSKFVLISNGSLMHQPEVQRGLRTMEQYHGEVWFKLDSATNAGRIAINDSKQTTEKTLANLKQSALCCETSLQTCLVDYLTSAQAEQERQAFLELLNKNTAKIKKIMLYTVARASLQPEAQQLRAVSTKQMNLFAQQIRELGYSVTVT